MFKAANRECVFHIWALWCTVVVYKCMLPCFSVYKLPVTYCPFGDSLILRKIYIINRRLFWIWIWTATTSNRESQKTMGKQKRTEWISSASSMTLTLLPCSTLINELQLRQIAAVNPSQVVVRRPSRIYFHKASKVMAALKLVWKCCQLSRTITQTHPTGM